jgi:hypothetical protein
MFFMACGTEIVVERFDIAEFKPKLPGIRGCLVRTAVLHSQYYALDFYARRVNLRQVTIGAMKLGQHIQSLSVIQNK